MKAFKWVTLLILVTFVALAATLYLVSESVPYTSPTLKEHPHAHWSGAADGGLFFEITQAEPPRYLLEVRNERGELWIRGWITYDSAPLKNSDFLGHAGELVYLNNGAALKIVEVSD
jgi:hypothetical protein